MFQVIPSKHFGIGSISLFYDLNGHHVESRIPVQDHKVYIFYEKVHDFIVSVKEGKATPIPGNQIVINQAIIDGILRSSEQGREVKIYIPG